MLNVIECYNELGCENFKLEISYDPYLTKCKSEELKAQSYAF